MANIKSAIKRVRQSEKSRLINLARKTSIKTAIKKVNDAVKTGSERSVTEQLLRDVQAKLARAKSKGVIHANTAARKMGRLAKKVSQAYRA